MADAISIDLSKEIGKLLEQYGDVITEDLKKIVPEVAKETIQELKKTSPRKTGRYAKSWKSKNSKSRVYADALIYNEQGQLTHLLEFSHPMPQGGRSRAFPHIKPAEEKAIESLEKKVEAAIDAAVGKI